MTVEVATPAEPAPAGRRTGPIGAPDAVHRRSSRPSAGVRRRHTARWIAGLVLVVLAALVALLATRPPATATEVVHAPCSASRPRPSTGTTVTGRASISPPTGVGGCS